ncbi:MAG: thrombospondin type 3 repeat-containing protein, partial [Bdellovibrionales bacterium]|nr:thrombospondin type 3 repeat-containing protein [Bdellovibrionales bacterium]
MFCQNLIKILCLFLLVHSSIFGSAELDAQYRFSAINRRARYTPYRNMTRFPVYKDRDQDGVLNFSDNCPNIPNEDQLDSDNDDFGNVCDNCPYVSNKGQQDSDGDGIGDACEQAFSTPAPTPTPTPTPSVEPASPQISDSDGDGIADSDDNCPNIPNSDQSDHDGNGLGDACDFDSDGDGISDSEDNCPRVKNPGQADHDGDGLGDKCDSDAPQIQDQDEDDYADDIDNCPEIYNPWQMDDDQDGIGNECDDCPGATVDECGVCGGDGKSCADPCASYRFQVGINPVGRGLNPYRGGRRGLSNVLVLHQKSAP